MRLDEIDNVVRATLRREFDKYESMNQFADNVFDELDGFLPEELQVEVWAEVDQLFVEVNSRYQWVHDVEGVKFNDIFKKG